MKLKRKIALIITCALCAVCTAFAFGCAVQKQYYTVTFMDGDAVYQTLQAEKGERISEYPAAPLRENGNYLFEGWYKDKEGLKVWDDAIERVNADTLLYSKFIYVDKTPSCGAMQDKPFSNTLTWLQRGVDVGAEFTVELFRGKKISSAEYAYESGKCFTDSGLSVANGKLSSQVYKNNGDIAAICYTPAVKPQGGVYKAVITVGGEQAEFKGLLFKGEGTQTNPYLIDSADDFASLSAANVSGGVCYKLNKNILLSSSSASVAGHTFNGRLDGARKSVTLEASDSALFDTLGADAVIEELTVKGAILNVPRSAAGVIANVNGGRILNCTVEANITSEVGEVGVLEGGGAAITGGAGGFVGINNGTISYCEYGGTVKARVGGGGFAAVNCGVIQNCSFTGTAGAGNKLENGDSTKAFSYMGGIAGINCGTISCCGATGSGKLLAQRSINGKGANNNIGGIAGLNKSGAKIEHCYFDGGRVYGNNNVGGIAGENSGKISQCFAAGAYRSNLLIKEGEEVVYLGHSYIGGSSQVGGIVGLSNADGSVENCFVTANVYAYVGNAYKVAEKSLNSVYLTENLCPRDFTVCSGEQLVKTAATALIAPSGEGNASVDAAQDDRVSATYKLSAEYSELLNGKVAEGETAAFIVKSGALRLECEGKTNHKEYKITVTVVGDGGNTFEVSSTAGNKGVPMAADKEGFYVSGYSLLQGGEAVFKDGAPLGYADLEEYGEDIVLYPVYTEGERPQASVLNVAVWNRYVSVETVAALLNEFEKWDGFDSGWSVNYKDVTASNNSKFVTEFNKGNNGRYNIGFAYKSKDCDFGQINFEEIYIANQNSSGAYENLKVGLMTNDDIVKAFVAFLKTPAAQKLMCPDFITEDEAQKIEITLFNGNVQMGGKLIVSNATGAEDINLPAAEGEGTFAGWALTQTAEDGETLLSAGSYNYQSVKAFANVESGSIKLYARFTAEQNYQLTVAIHLGDSYITEKEADDLIAAFTASLAGTPNENIKINLIKISENGAADANALVKANSAVEVYISGNNMDNTSKYDGVALDAEGVKANAGTGWFANTSRKVGIIDGKAGNGLAKLFYEFVKAPKTQA